MRVANEVWMTKIDKTCHLILLLLLLFLFFYFCQRVIKSFLNVHVVANECVDDQNRQNI